MASPTVPVITLLTSPPQIISRPHPSPSPQVKEYVPPPPESADVSVPTNMSLDQLRGLVETKRAALEAWCRTAYGEVGLARAGRFR